MTSEAKTARAVIDKALAFLGTPYRHQGSEAGVGCDCLGLVRGVWRAVYGREPEPVPAYAPDWAEGSGEERLLEAATRHFGAPVARDAMQPGDLLLFRFRPGLPAKHAGILIDARHFLHAYDRAAVTLSPLVPGWQRRIAAVFRFPDP